MRLGGFSEFGRRNIETPKQPEVPELGRNLTRDIFKQAEELQELQRQRDTHEALFGLIKETPETNRVVKKAMDDPELMKEIKTISEAKRLEIPSDYTEYKKLREKLAEWGKKKLEEAKVASVEAQRRLSEAREAETKALKAQAFYNGLSDVTTGKSARESAEVIEKAFKNEVEAEVLKRTAKSKIANDIQELHTRLLSRNSANKSAQQSATIIEQTSQIEREIARRTSDSSSKVAKRAQHYYSSLSNLSAGKSAKDSAAVIEEALNKADAAIEAVRRATNKNLADIKAQDAQKFFNSLSDSTVGKSAKDSAQAIEAALKEQAGNFNTNNVKSTIKNLLEKLTSTSKNKLVKLVATVITLLSVLLFTIKSKFEK